MAAKPASAPKLAIVGDAVASRTPPPELAFVEALRDHIAAYAADHPRGISFAVLKDQVKAFGRAKHTSVRFLRGGILGVVNNLLVPDVVIQLEAAGNFFATRSTHFPRASSSSFNFPPPPLDDLADARDDDRDVDLCDTNLVTECLESVLGF